MSEIPPKNTIEENLCSNFPYKKRHNTFHTHNFLFPIRGCHSKGKRAQGIIEKKRAGSFERAHSSSCHFI
ncbi:hypothetical protein A7K93_02490 [Candidatus Methylacidiphilum fumarolicum]|nr:hypothetical protein A7K73_00715 [Candidatus Methylacidiphilum fumarolicum]TFE73521.1 hypothetical protein A7K72_06355 [Candidatus Methylacidiphilum fumarolicum]TFE75018.1 hypothetical protein A7K93_02490 [Candidatus Methylacidiphilum fumarolicum]TFE76563.1 hypothetical protein A7D33_09495 [Candidatus Methylacidiphilum fumarolicum]